MSNETTETTKKEIKQAWSKIINKNKDNVIIVPPHRSEQKIDPITLSWDEFNENFTFDEKDKTHCYTKPESKYAELFSKNYKKVEKKESKKPDKKDITKAKAIKKVINKPPRKRQRADNATSFEYTMSIGDMIKNSIKKE